MSGAYIADDYYFFFDLDKLRSLGKTGEIACGTFVCADPNHSTEESAPLMRMRLWVFLDKVLKTRPSESRIIIKAKKKECHLIFSPGDFKEWFINPEERVLKHGPNWRFGSANVYIKTDRSDDAESFRNTIYSFIQQAPEPARPNYKKIRLLKRARK